MNQAAYLHRLQRVDTQIDQSQARLAEIERLISEDENVRRARLATEEARKNAEKSRLALRAIEHNASETRIKMEQSEASLYGGAVRNPKELQDLQREIASLKARLAQLEDQQLSAMIELESNESTEEQARTNLTQVQARASEEKAGLAGERTSLQKNLQRLETERSAVLPPILAGNLETYNRLREQKKGAAVTTVEDDTCGTCGSEVRPSESQAARLSTSLHFCNFCGRILYAG